MVALSFSQDPFCTRNIGLIRIVTTGARKFFADVGVAGAQLRRLEDAWSKAVRLHITQWPRPYAKEGLW